MKSAIPDLLTRAQRARSGVLDSHSSPRIIAALSETASQWLDPGFAPRRRLLEELPGRIQLAAPMLERGLDHIFSVVSQEALCRLVADAGRAGLLGPSLIYYGLSGNIPGLAIAPIVVSLLARSVCLIRDSARQPLLTRAFVDTLAHNDAELAAMVVSDSWGHGAEAAALNELIVANAERIELYGSDATLTKITQRYRDAQLPTETLLITRGSRLSVGVIANDVEPTEWAAAFAEDLVMYDGMGCLSPQLIIVEGQPDRAASFARQLGAALDEYQRRWPRQHRNVATEASRRAFIDSAELATAAKDGDVVLRGGDDAWCIHLAPSRPLTLGPGLRCVSIGVSKNRDHTLAQLGGSSVPLAGVGLTPSKSAALSSDAVEALHHCGATLVCTPGCMQAPPIAWSQDGVPRLASLLDQQR